VGGRSGRGGERLGGGERGGSVITFSKITGS